MTYGSEDRPDPEIWGDKWEDIGHGQYIARTSDASGPDAGLLLAHQRPDGEWCVGAVPFRNQRVTWDVVSLDPLTINPSVLCGCGVHGWLRDGQWVPA